MTVQLLRDIPLSPLGFGCYALAGAYGKKITEADAIQLLNRAFELGFRFFDTANSYGSTEQLLGTALREHRHEISIATKVGLALGNRRDLSLANVLNACEISLRNLRTDYIDLYQVHFDDPATPVEETVAALEKLKETGKIRHYGIGHLPLQATRSFIDIGKPSSIMMELSPVATNRYREFTTNKEIKSLDIIAFSITGRGLISGRHSAVHALGDIRRLDSLFRRSKLKLGLSLSEELESLGHKYALTPTQVAIQWVMERPGVTIALTGPTRAEHLEENSRALESCMDQADIDLVSALIARYHMDLRKLLPLEIGEILRSPLVSAISQAQADLVYVLEYCSEEMVLESRYSAELFRRTIQATELQELSDVHRKLREIWDSSDKAQLVEP